MKQAIKVEQAELKTASIEVKTLVVNNRKLTLSVFRQIPRTAPPLELMGNGNICFFHGIIWGQVNYYWGGMDSNCPHLLYQKDNQLYRTLLEKPRSPMNVLGIFNEDPEYWLYDTTPNGRYSREDIKPELYGVAKEIFLLYESFYEEQKKVQQLFIAV